MFSKISSEVILIVRGRMHARRVANTGSYATRIMQQFCHIAALPVGAHRVTRFFGCLNLTRGTSIFVHSGAIKQIRHPRTYEGWKWGIERSKAVGTELVALHPRTSFPCSVAAPTASAISASKNSSMTALTIGRRKSASSAIIAFDRAFDAIIEGSTRYRVDLMLAACAGDGRIPCDMCRFVRAILCTIWCYTQVSRSALTGIWLVFGSQKMISSNVLWVLSALVSHDDKPALMLSAS
jgi:hypothetical protein